MAHQSNGRGSAVVKMKFRGVGTIRRAIGSREQAVVDDVELMYKSLYKQSRLDVLEAIRDKRIHPLVVLSQWRQGKEIDLPPADVLLQLEAAWLAWEEKLKISESYRATLGVTRRALNIPKEATLAKLPMLLKAYMERCEKSGKTASANHGRNHVRAFLRDTVGPSHKLYTAVKDMRPLASDSEPEDRGTPHPMPLILGLVPKLNALLAGAGDMAWSMAAYGMGNKEYWHDGFDVLDDRVLIHGEKKKRRRNNTRDRAVMRWAPEALVAPVCTEKKFRALLAQASGERVAIYDLRRSFARWTEEALIIESNRAAYMGHGPKTMTQLYSWGELPGQLLGDANKMQAYRDQTTTQIVTPIAARRRA